MAELFPIPLAEQIACVEREVALRDRVYANRVASGAMTQSYADRQIAAMRAVLNTLLSVRDGYGDRY